MNYNQLVLEAFNAIRRFSEKICEPLLTEDYVVQSMPDVSPPKWHLGHTTWFFETFLLVPFLKNYEIERPEFKIIFNSYYKTVSQHFQRCRRGILSRPTVEETYRYRHRINERITELFSKASEAELRIMDPILTLGLHHEQQHQELLLTDIKHIFWENPLRPAYQSERQASLQSEAQKIKLQMISLPGGLKEIGFNEGSFAFDHERPRHKVFLNEYSIASRLVTNGEFLEFMEARGYQIPSIWLSEGWNCIEKHHWRAPLYWEKIGNQWWNMTLSGMKPVALDEPVCHVSFFEADAFCKWKEARLPSEAEWEVLAAGEEIEGNFVESTQLHPMAGVINRSSASRVHQLFGDVWEWTMNSFEPYPGFKPLPGSMGEYNGKFMCNQMILRGGSCVTPQSHIRATYRNFFAPDTRWQFSGFRLAKAPSLHDSSNTR